MKKKKVGARLLSALMSLTLMLGLLPTAALAAEAEPAPEEVIEETAEAPAEDAGAAEEAAEETDAAAVLAEENTLKEGTYTVTANLYVPGKENIIMPGQAAYLTNTLVPPLAPVSKNAKLTVDAKGGITLNLYNLNAVFTLQNIEDGEGLHITDREMEEGDFAGRTSRIKGLEIQLTEKKDVYSFTNCQEQPLLFGLPMQTMGLELKVEWDTIEEGFLSPSESVARTFSDMYKGYDEALTGLDVTVYTADPALVEKLDDAVMTVTPLDEFSAKQALLDGYTDPKPEAKLFQVELKDSDGNDAPWDGEKSKITFTFSGRTFLDDGQWPEIVSYNAQDGKWVDWPRTALKLDSYCSLFSVTVDQLGVFAGVETGYDCDHYFYVTSEVDGARLDYRSSQMWYFRDMLYDVYMDVSLSTTDLGDLGTAYQLKVKSPGNTEIEKRVTTATLTVPYDKDTNYYLVSWDTKALTVQNLNSTSDDEKTVITVLGEDDDPDGKYQLQLDMKNPAATSGTKRTAFVLATKLTTGHFVSQPSMGLDLPYNGEDQTMPMTYNAEEVTVTGDTTGKAVGDYTVTVTPKEGNIWADGTAEPKTITWSIYERRLTVDYDETIHYGEQPTFQVTVNGFVGEDSIETCLTEEAQSKLVLNEKYKDRREKAIANATDESGFIKPGTYSGSAWKPETLITKTDLTEEAQTKYVLNSGKGQLTVLSDNSGDDNKTDDKHLTSSPIPEKKTLTWTGLEQQIIHSTYVGFGTKFVVTGQNWGKDPGKYTCTVTLSEGYTWPDGTNEPVTFDWYIKKTASAPTAVTGLTYNGKEQVGVPEGEGYTVTGGTAKAAGTYTATVTLDENYMWSDASLADSFTLTYEIASTGGSSGGNTGVKEDKTETITANLFVPGELNKQLPGVTAYLTNGNNPNGEGGYDKKAPTEPVYDNAELTTHADGTRTLVLDIPNPVFTLQKLSGAPDGVEVVRAATTKSSAPSGKRISQVTIDLPAKGDTFVFTDCEEYPTLLSQTWNVDLTLKLGKSGLDSKTDVDTSGATGGNKKQEVADITVKVSGDTATVSKINTKDVSSKSGLTLDATDGKDGVTGAKLPVSDLETVADEKVPNVTVKLSDTSVDLDLTALKAALKAVSGKTLDVRVLTGSAAEKKLNAAQKTALTNAKNGAAVSVELSSNSKTITDLGGGKLTVTAPYKWDGKGAVVAWQMGEDGKLTAVPVTCKNNVATLTLTTPGLFLLGTVDVKSFIDVPADAYYKAAVDWAVANGVTSGLTETTFAPNATCTRAQTVTFLWRAAGSPEPGKTANPFTDVKADAYYYKAVLWAVEKGITSGTTATTFSPDATVSRGQVVTFQYRMAGSPKTEGTNAFTDVAENAYYHDAVLWVAKNGITSGTTATTFAPNAGCTRGQIVTFLYRQLAK